MAQLSRAACLNALSGWQRRISEQHCQCLAMDPWPLREMTTSSLMADQTAASLEVGRTELFWRQGYGPTPHNIQVPQALIEDELWWGTRV